MEVASIRRGRTRPMAGEPATTTYVIPEPFEQASKLIRRLLAGANLRITGELNLSGRIYRHLLIETSPCVVLFVSPSAEAPESGASNPYSAALAPLHVVISARDSHTEIHILRALPREDGRMGQSGLAALGRLQATIFQAIETIGMRASVAV